MKRRSILFLIAALVVMMFQTETGYTAGNSNTIKTLHVKNVNARRIVIKSGSKKKLKVAVNKKTVKKVWKYVKFSSKNKKIARVTKKGVIEAKKEGKTQVVISSRNNYKGTKKKIKIRVIVYDESAIPTELPDSDAVLLPTSEPMVSAAPDSMLSPSSAPTLSPSSAPTLSPSSAPTLSPSPTSTLSPSPTPTLSPSPTPTLSPSPTPMPTPSPTPARGAANNGNYRNLFAERGHTEEEINDKLEKAWQRLFYGSDNEKIYYPVGDDMAYIYTVDSNDVRSEGMSYGMMICVQLDKKNEFDKLWKWAKTYMQHSSGDHKNYFAWQCSTDGSKMDNTPATDGDEYFVTALLFASARWGNGEGIYNYNEQAQAILDAMLHQSDDQRGINMFDKTYKMPVFCPVWGASSYTDPSYHLPAFYEVWALLADKDNEFWNEAADVSRNYFKKVTNESTGLGPDYSEFDGRAKNQGNHGDFRFDAWRIASNIACDYAWWGENDWAVTHADTIQEFFYKQGIGRYGNQWTLDGSQLGYDHSPGLVAMNAVASLAADNEHAGEFVDELWNISPTSGRYRYYDGCLYMLGLLHCSGNFRAYFPQNSTN